VCALESLNMPSFGMNTRPETRATVPVRRWWLFQAMSDAASVHRCHELRECRLCFHACIRAKGRHFGIYFNSSTYTPCPEKRCHLFFCCNFYKYWRIFIIFSCTTSQENAKVVGVKIYCHTFVMLLPYRVKVSDTKVTHFTPKLALCTCLYRSHLRKPVSMKQTKHSRKSEAQFYVQNVHDSHEHMHSNDYATAQSLMVSVAVSTVQSWCYAAALLGTRG